MGKQTNHFAEAYAFLLVTKAARKSGARNVIFEGDSLNIVKEALGESEPTWSIAKLILESKNHLNHLDHFIIQHSYNEGNQAADLMANIGVEILCYQ